MPSPDPGEAQPAGLLVPVLAPEDGPPDAVAVAAWHLALSNLISVEVPHDLLGLWVFPAGGGTQLLAPEELGKDRIEVPAPEPFLHQHELFQLEERVRHAGYRSAIAVPIRGPHRDVGLALFAGLAEGIYGIAQALRLSGLARDLVPMFEALAVAPPFTGFEGAPAGTTADELPEVAARSLAEVRSGPELLRVLSGILRVGLPHERLEIALPGVLPGRWALLSGAQSGTRWGEGNEPASGAADALVERRDPEGILLVQDLRAAGLSWPSYGARAGQRIRSVLGIELPMADVPSAWLLVGGAAPNVFRPVDRETLARLAPVVALRIHGFRQSLAAEVGQAQLHALRSGQPRASQLVQMLAETAHWGEAARRYEREVCDALGYRTVRFALRWGEDRIVTLAPGDVRPLGDLPAEPVDLCPVAPLLRGSGPFLVYGDQGENLAVPLRIAGRPVGALELLGGAPTSAGHAVTAAQQFADVIAPHLELLRRSALPARGARPGEPSPTGRSGWLRIE